MLDGATSEKTAPENGNLDGFDDIEDIKQQIEAVCPGVVSCADILVMATRDTLNIVSDINSDKCKPIYSHNLLTRDLVKKYIT